MSEIRIFFMDKWDFSLSWQVSHRLPAEQRKITYTWCRDCRVFSINAANEHSLMTRDSWETCVSQGHKDCLYRILRWHNENSVNMFQSPNPTFFFQAMHPYNLHINGQHDVLNRAGYVTFTLNVIILFVVCRGCSSFVMCCIRPGTLMFRLCSSTTPLCSISPPAFPHPLQLQCLN